MCQHLLMYSPDGPQKQQIESFAVDVAAAKVRHNRARTVIHDLLRPAPAVDDPFRLQLLVALQEAVADELDRGVQRARAAGTPWATIATWFKVSTQTIHERYHKGRKRRPIHPKAATAAVDSGR